MKKNEKIIIGVGIGVLLLLWLRNRNKTQDVLDETGGGAGSEGGSYKSGGIGGGGAVGINPNAIGGATPVVAPVVLTAPVYAQQTLRPLPIQTRERVREMAQKPMATPASPTPNTSFAKFDGSFRSPSKLDFDGHIED